MIVRDEEALLEGCLRSLAGLVDEIVLVDTGSRDRTREIALDCGARLYEATWVGDFSAARNRALERSRGAWILYIDADERVRPIDRESLEPVLSDSRNIAATVRFHPRTGFTAYPEYRLYRNDPRIRFEGAIHETPLPSIHRIASHESRVVAETPLTLDHLGYDGDQHRKHRRNLPMLARATVERPERSFLSWHLGAVREGLGDAAGAEAAWLRGVEAVRRKRTPAGGDVLPYVELIRLQVTGGRVDSGLLDEALALFPSDYHLQFVRGRVLVGQRRFNEAVPLFEGLTRVDGGSLVDTCAYDRRIFGHWSYDSLAYCHFSLGHFQQSEEYYALAEAAAPDDTAYRVKRQLAAARAGGRCRPSDTAGPDPARTSA